MPRRPEPALPAPPLAPELANFAPLTIPPEPDYLEYVLATHCTICGRPLTDLDSMIARVGTTCITVYGDQRLTQPNAAHAAWLRKYGPTQDARRREQAQAEATYRNALTAHEQAVASAAIRAQQQHAAEVTNWEAEVVARQRQSDHDHMVAMSMWQPAVDSARAGNATRLLAAMPSAAERDARRTVKVVRIAGTLVSLAAMIGSLVTVWTAWRALQ